MLFVALGPLACGPRDDNPCGGCTGDAPYDEVTGGDDYLTTRGDLRVARADGSAVAGDDTEVHFDGEDALLDVSVWTVVEGVAAGQDAGPGPAATDDDAGAAVDASDGGADADATPPLGTYRRVARVTWTPPPVTGEMPVTTTFDLRLCPRVDETLVDSCVLANGTREPAEHLVVEGTYRRSGPYPQDYAIAIETPRVHVAVTRTRVVTPVGHDVSCY